MSDEERLAKTTCERVYVNVPCHHCSAIATRHYRKFTDDYIAGELQETVVEEYYLCRYHAIIRMPEFRTVTSFTKRGVL